MALALDLNELIEEIDTRYGDQGRKVAKQGLKRARKLERKLEKRAKKLPIDTPLDSARRARAGRRAGRAVLFVVVVGSAVAAYLAWKQQRDRASGYPEHPQASAPDVFGEGVRRAEAPSVAAPTG